MSSPTTTVVLKRERLRPGLARHPWVYPDAVLRIEGNYTNGDAVVVTGPDGQQVGQGFINDRSHLLVRMVTFEKEDRLDDELLRSRVRRAVHLRQEVLRLQERATAYRLLHSEGDGVPGLIVDRYAGWLVLSCTSLGVARRLDPIADELERLCGPAGIIERGRAEGLRAREGLGEGRGVLRGEAPPGLVEIAENEVRYLIEVMEGQKTGFFLDQRENRRRAAELAAGRRVLDACCFTGAFAVAMAAKGEAASVEAFDSSARAVELAAENARLNGVPGLEPRRAEMFTELKRLRDAGRTFDMIVLDPPRLARTRADVPRALSGLRELNSTALRLLAPGGILLTCVCNHHVEDHQFLDTLREAARRARREASVLEQRGAGADHPYSLHCPEGRYLRAFVLGVV